MPVEVQFLLINGSREHYWLQVLREALAPLGALAIRSATEVFNVAFSQRYDSIIVDATEVEDPPALIASLRARQAGARIVVVTASPTWRRARAAFQAGAMEYIPKSLGADELRATFARLLARLPEAEPPASARAPDARAQATMLFADNDPFFLNTRKEFLEQAGYCVLTATSAAEARSLLSEQRLDVAILDIRLEDDNDEQDMSGLLLAQETAPSVPKIILTGFPSYDYVRVALASADDRLPVALAFIAKKEGSEALLHAVQAALHARQAPSAPAGEAAM